MPFDPENRADIKTLRDEIRLNTKRMEPFVDFHRLAVEQYASSYYGALSDSPENPLNGLETLITTLRSELAAQPPQANVRTYANGARGAGLKLQLVLNDRLRTDREAFEALTRAIDNSFFSVGILRVGVDTPDVLDMGGVPIKRSQPFFETILLEDHVHDMNAPSLREVEFSGHRYRMNIEEAQEYEYFDKAARRRLKADVDRAELHGIMGMNQLSAITSPSERGIYQKVTLWDIWLPNEKLLITIPDQPAVEGEVLRVVKWDGPSHGPYLYLAYNTVDGNTMPLSPCMTIMPLHLTQNNLVRKLNDDAEAFKQICLAPGPQDGEDVRNIQVCGNGEIAGVSDPAAIIKQTYGGIDPNSLAYALQVNQWLSQQGGNTNLAGGLAAGAETLGQEQILAGQVSRRMEAMRDKVNRFVQEAISDYGYWLWQDQFTEFPITYKGDGGEVETVFSPLEREHSYYEHAVWIEPYSMSLKTPTQRYGELVQAISQVFLPLAQLGVQQGMTINMRELAKLTAQMRDMPELNDIITFQEPVEDGSMGGAPGEARQAAQTHRINTRISGRSQGSQQADMMRAMMSQGGGE